MYTGYWLKYFSEKLALPAPPAAEKHDLSRLREFGEIFPFPAVILNFEVKLRNHSLIWLKINQSELSSLILTICLLFGNRNKIEIILEVVNDFFIFPALSKNPFFCREALLFCLHYKSEFCRITKNCQNQVK